MWHKKWIDLICKYHIIYETNMISYNYFYLVVYNYHKKNHSLLIHILSKWDLSFKPSTMAIKFINFFMLSKNRK
jgi:hypothetical protein